MGEGRCAIPRRPTTPEAAAQEREALRRVRDPEFDPEEGFEWPGESEGPDGADGPPR